MVQDIASNRDRAEKPLPLPPYKLIPSRLEKALPTSEDAGPSSGGDMATFLRTFAFPHLEHALALNDFLIAARLVERSVPSISLVDMRHDLDLKKTPVKVTVERRLPYGDRIDEKVTVIPDGWLDFRQRIEGQEKRKRRCIVVELDRGTTSIAPFKEKFRAYY